MKQKLAIALTLVALVTLAGCADEAAVEPAAPELGSLSLDETQAAALFEMAAEAETLEELQQPLSADGAGLVAERSARIQLELAGVRAPVGVNVLTYCFATCLGPGCRPNGCRPTSSGSCSRLECVPRIGGSSCGRGSCSGRTIVIAGFEVLDLLRPQLPEPTPDPLPPGVDDVG